jgi:MFS family permease
MLMLVSSVMFVSAGEPDTSVSSGRQEGFLPFLGEGLRVYREDGRFRLFLYSQWLGGAALMALPFYVIQAQTSGVDAEDVPLLLGAQTIGALASNALWGRWGDRRGKQSLLEGVAVLRIAPPLAALVLSALVTQASTASLTTFLALFFGLGALVNGTTIAMLGYLMEISPDDRRPAYSGYFNAFVAPASLLPIIGGVIVDAMSLHGVFVAAAIAAIVQLLTVRRLRDRGGVTD